MNISQIKSKPFPEGIIRVATHTDPATQKTVFGGAIEVLARHHSKANETPTLADHPINADLLNRHTPNKSANKVVEVPIRMFFNQAGNALQAAYQAYDHAGRPVCRGNGQVASRRVPQEGSETIAQANCNGPETCEFANSGQATCRRQVSMTVQIKDQDNPLSVFEVRSSSYNCYKTLQGQLALIERRFGGLRHVPLKLQLWQTSNQASEYESFDVFKIALDAPSEIEAMRQVKAARLEAAEVGLCDDTDSAFAGEEPTLDIGQDDFVFVEDFYRPIRSTATAGRRGGSKSVAASLTGQENPTIGNLAGNMIAKAMAAAGHTRATKIEVAEDV